MTEGDRGLGVLASEHGAHRLDRGGDRDRELPAALVEGSLAAEQRGLDVRVSCWVSITR